MNSFTRLLSHVMLASTITTSVVLAQTCAPFASVETNRWTDPAAANSGWFGLGVALDGDTAVVYTAQGCEVWQRSGTTWTLQTTLAPAGSGFYVPALSGDVIAIGRPGTSTSQGRVNVYRRIAGVWTFETQFAAAIPQNGSLYGAGVAVSGNYIAVGAPNFDFYPNDPYDNGHGKVEIFQYAAGVWTRVAMLGDAYDSGLGAPLAIGTTSTGSVIVASFYLRAWELQGTNWVPQQFADPGPAFVGPSSIAIQNGVIAMGSSEDNYAGTAAAGSLFLFEKQGVVWQVHREFHASDSTLGGRIGSSVALCNGVVVTGAYSRDSLGALHSTAYLFTVDGPGPFECDRLLPNETEATWNGLQPNVAISGNTVVVGTPGASYGGATAAGSAHMFVIGDPAVTYCTAGLSAIGCTSIITTTGTPSASAAAPFHVDILGAEGQRNGMILYGISGAAFVPWGSSSSYLCVAPPRQRCGTQWTGGTSGACDGALALEWNVFSAFHPSALGQPWFAGARVWLQGWMRDPGTVKGSALSNALAFVVRP